MQRSAFSLVELSIVLVILGLLTGGVLTGQNLIRAAELRSVTTELNNYQTAVMAFKDKYLAFPGDMSNATDFWGAKTGCGATPSGTGTQTCNGDGTGLISSDEKFTFWQHLSNSGLIEGSYTGEPLTGTYIAGPGENLPVSKFPNGIWSVTHWNVIGNSSNFDNNYGNHFLYGAISVAPWINSSAVLSPIDAWGIDKKIDDGMPATGKLLVSPYVACTDALAGESAKTDAVYQLDEEEINCVLHIKIGL